MKLIDTIRRLLTTSSYETPPKPTDIFPGLDIGKIKSDMELQKKGKKQGLQNKPSSDALTFDEIENQIISLIENKLDSSYQRFRDEFSTYKSRLALLGLTAIKNRLDALSTAVKGQFLQTIIQGKNTLYICKRDIAEAKKELMDFKRNHRINRPAHYPESRFYRWSIIFLLFVTESIINGIIFARGHEFGYVGGVSEAFLISAINIGLGLIVGWFIIRFINHRKMLLRAIGFLVTSLYVAELLGFNLLVAHYRVLFEKAGAEVAATAAISNFLDSPFMISDFHSLLLIILGITFSIIAAIDGYTMDDPYPSYGALARYGRDLELEYTRQLSKLQDDIGSIRNEAVRDCEDLERNLSNRESELRSIVAGASALQESIRRRLRYLEDCCNTLLHVYRESNRQHRTTPPPAYFAENWHLDSHRLTQQGLEKDFSFHLKEAQQTIEKTHRTARAASKTILQEFQNAIDAFKTLEHIDPHIEATITDTSIHAEKPS